LKPNLVAGAGYQYILLPKHYHSHRHTFTTLDDAGSFIEKRVMAQIRKDRQHVLNTAKQEQAAEEVVEVREAERKKPSKSTPEPRKYGWGEAVSVDYEGEEFDGLIVNIPQGEKTFDFEDNEECYSLFYPFDDTFEHAVVASRITGLRKETQQDVDAKRLLLETYKETRPTRNNKRPRLAIPEKSTNNTSKAFLEQVRERLGATSHGYFLFLNAVNEGARGGISLGELRDLVWGLLDEEPDLVIAFNAFLPPKWNVSPKMLRHSGVEGHEEASAKAHSLYSSLCQNFSVDQVEDFKLILLEFYRGRDFLLLDYRTKQLFANHSVLLEKFGALFPVLLKEMST
jgi:hypothetical protein